MPKHVARADCCLQKALGFLLKYRNMAYPDAMKLADFSAQEQACCAKRMCLHCLWKKAKSSKNDEFVTPPPQVIDLSIVETESSSSVTNDSGGVQEEVEVVSKWLMAKITCISLPIKAAWIRHAEAVKKKREMNQAFKCATILYARQQEKSDGMPAQSVVDLIKNETGVELSRRTIQQKVKDGNVGMSPLQ
jgi:hypothetical protein